jgi:hypothetical protein
MRAEESTPQQLGYICCRGTRCGLVAAEPGSFPHVGMLHIYAPSHANSKAR